jgi:hypothetical protein
VYLNGDDGSISFLELQIGHSTENFCKIAICYFDEFGVGGSDFHFGITQQPTGKNPNVIANQFISVDVI